MASALRWPHLATRHPRLAIRMGRQARRIVCWRWRFAQFAKNLGWQLE
uniref:Uncharacterized protein n=1 Tax=Arundo donax TaxID=35708 RepID=A0A0A9SUK6_ARUDO